MQPGILLASGDTPLPAKSTGFIAALRPFSLIVALATCGLGVALAGLDGGSTEESVGWLAVAVITAGLLLQVGVNLINDYPDLKRLPFGAPEQAAVLRNARIGFGAIVVACGIGLWIAYLRGWAVLVLGAAGVFGLWAYAAEPVNLKSRGLGLPAVFLLTGVLMVAGSFYAMTGELTPGAVLWSTPLGLFAMLLLLANELRDSVEDARVGLRTFTVRYGDGVAARLYIVLGAMILCLTAGLAIASDRAPTALACMALTFLPLRSAHRPPEERATLARHTGRAYALYALVLIPMIWVTNP